MYRALLCAAAGVLFISTAAAQEGIKRTPLATIDGPPGYQIIMSHVEALVPNVCGQRHTHFRVESSYILDGEFTLKIDGQPDRLMKAGDVGQILAGVVHGGCIVGSGGKVLTYISLRKANR